MDLGLTRRNIGRLALLFWAVMLAWLARRQFASGGSAGTAERARRLEPGAQYFQVLAQGRQIGQLNLGADTLVDGVRLTEQFVLDLPVSDSTRQLARGAEYFLSRALRLRNFTRTSFGIGPAERLDATLGADSILGLVDAEGGAAATGRVRLRIDPDAILPTMLPYRAAFGGHLRVGESFSVQLIDLGGPGTRPLRVQVAAESTFVVPDSAAWDSAGGHWVAVTSDTVRAWRLDHDAPGAPTQTWIDAGGALVHQETQGGLTLVRSAFEIVSTNYRRTRRSEKSTWRRAIPGMLVLAATGRAPDTDVPRRFFLVSGGGRNLDGGRQSLHGDTLVVAADSDAPGDAEEQRLARAPSWDLPEATPGMVSVANQVLGRARSARDSIRALTLWVARQVATDTTLGAFGTALNAFQLRRANADGKARLLATLARASRIPARVVTGVAVLPAGVFSHSWAELWDGRWIAADPTFGQVPASSSLIRVAIGERSRPVDLLPLVASARFLPIRPSR